MKTAFLLVSLALATATAQAQTGAPLWTNFYSGPGNRADIANAVAVDSSGNVFVTGQSEGGTSAYDYVTLKYSSGGVPLWTNSYGGVGLGNDASHAIAVDTSGNVFVTGSSYATVAYSSTGLPLWTNRYIGLSNSGDIASSVAVDRSGNVIVTGSSYDGPQVNPHYATVAYSSAGVPLWTNRYIGPGKRTDIANAMAVDSSGNVFVTGYSSSDSNNLSSDYATVAYSNTGVPLWTNRYHGPTNSYDRAYAVAVDNGGNVLVTGYSHGIGSSSDYATIKYSGAGAALWTNRYDGPTNRSDFATAVAADRSGNVFVTGGSYGGVGSPYSDYATVAYSSAGVPLWTNCYNGPGNNYDFAHAVAVDASGNVIVAGGSWGSTGYDDFATIAYSNAGVPLWTNRFNGAANGGDQPQAIAVDGSGNVFVTGYTGVSGGNYDYATIKYSSSVQAWLDIQQMNDQVLLTWTNAAFGLQSAPGITGTFTNISGATSPYTNPITGAQGYFRLISY